MSNFFNCHPSDFVPEERPSRKNNVTLDLSGSMPCAAVEFEILQRELYKTSAEGKK